MSIEGIGNMGSSSMGPQMALERTHSGHIGSQADKAQSEGGGESFSSTLMNGLSEVNSLQQKAADMSVAAAVNPDQVDAHDVTIATAKAEMGLNLTKQIVDRAVQGYKDISNLR